MKEIIVKIKYDERRGEVDSSFVEDALQVYTKGSGIISVEDVDLKFTPE